MTAPASPLPMGRFQVAAGHQAEQARRRAILAAHPEIRRLYGPNPLSALVILALVAGQWGMAFLLRDQPWWLAPLAAFGIGAFLANGLTALVHEACHGLVFGRPGPDRLAGLAANLGLVTPSAMAFFHYHGWHHAWMGDYEMDVGIPTEAEAHWVGDRAWRKAVWLAAFPYFQWRRTLKFQYREPFWDGWMIANLVLQVAADLVLYWLTGWVGIAYLLLSYLFSIGFHPLGTRVVQEHFLVREGEETSNYIGPGSLLELNFGYHAHHHDFPRVAWNRLPAIARLAPEFYADVPTHRSRIALMASFILDRRWTVWRHAVRP